MAGEYNARPPGWRQKRAPNEAEIERAAEPANAVQRAAALGPPTAPNVGDALTQGRLIHPQQPKDLTLAVARQNQQRCGAELWREPFHEPHRDLRTLAGVRVHQGGALLAGPPANSSTCIEQGAPAKCTDEPPAIGRAREVLSAGLNRRKPNRLKKVLCFRPPTSGSLSLPQELGEYAWRHVALRVHHLSLFSDGSTFPAWPRKQSVVAVLASLGYARAHRFSDRDLLTHWQHADHTIQGMPLRYIGEALQ
jgi:hypothetical protein